MCGIYGYIGNTPAYQIILNGLRRLEYRGYDSWGMATIANGRLYRVKQVGGIPEKGETLGTFPGNVGIGHTRWATHGIVSKNNAHPHFDCKNQIAIVHNGSIYNEITLRKRLMNNGHQLKSETDTELFAHLLEEKSRQSFIDDIYESLEELNGQYAFLLLNVKEGNKIYAIRNGSPLKIGFADKTIHISSDIVSFAGIVDEYIDLEDGDVATVSSKRLRIFDKNKCLVIRETKQVDITSEQVSKGDFSCFFSKEIVKGEVAAIENITNKYLTDDEIDLDIDFSKIEAVDRIILTGAGSSFFACLIGEQYLRNIAGFTDVNSVISGELICQYEYSKLNQQAKNTLAIAVTQSGETKDTLDAIKFMKSNGISVLTFVNKPGSEAEKLSDLVIKLLAEPEISVAATKSFIAQVLCLLLLSLAFAHKRRGPTDYTTNIIREVKRLPRLIKDIFSGDAGIKRIASEYCYKKAFYPLSRGINVPVALEIGRKLEEELYVHTVGTSLGTSAELKHGPLTMVKGESLIFIAASGKEYNKIVTNMREGQSRKARIIAVATKGDELISSITPDIIWIPQTDEFLSPLLSAAALHLLTYYLGESKKIKNLDRPRNLAKSVTVD